MTQIGFSKTKFNIKEYFKKNWGAPFIFGFMLLLLSTAFFSFDSLAICAYFALVAGIFFEFASFLRYRGESNDKVAE